jgi:hypothetical protein
VVAAMAAEVVAAMAAEVVAATTMSMKAKDAMAVATVEEVLEVIEATAEATADMVETEGAVAMAPIADTAAAATTITTSRHTIFKPAGSLFFDVFWCRHIRWVN